VSTLWVLPSEHKITNANRILARDIQGRRNFMVTFYSFTINTSPSSSGLHNLLVSFSHIQCTLQEHLLGTRLLLGT
jgi:hypothetical protein